MNEHPRAALLTTLGAPSTRIAPHRYVGNEFWKGMLSASGDPAAACCSTIAELFVPEINPLAAMLRGSVQERSTRCTAAAAARPAADL